MLRALALLLLVCPLLACSYSMISEGRLRDDDFDRLVSGAVAARGVPAPARIDARVIDSDEVPELVAAAVRESLGAEDVAAYQRGLEILGLWPRGRDLWETYLEVTGEEVAGLYLPSKRTLYVVEDFHGPFSVRMLSSFSRRDWVREFVLAHELIHVLQHRAYPELLDPAPDLAAQDDLGMALQAAIEGDALLFGMLAMGQPPVVPSVFAAEAMDEMGRSPAYLEAPALIRVSLDFPYTAGYPLAWEERTALLEAPAASTEQVLHPERRRAAFTAIDLAPLPLPAACAPVWESTAGELLISVLLQEHGEVVPLPAARGAAAGWDGDRWLALDCDGRAALLWLTLWDSAEDAGEFLEAYRAVLPALSAATGVPMLTAVQDGEAVRIAGGGLADWAADPAPWGAVRRARVSEVEALRAHFREQGGSE